MMSQLILQETSSAPALDLIDSKHPHRSQPRWIREADHAAGLKELSRIDACRAKAVVHLHYACGARIVIPISCNSRFCPQCARHRADRIVDMYEVALRKFRLPALVTLTVPNCQPGELARAVSVLAEAFRRLRRRKVWPSRQGIYAFEVKCTPERGYHPHIHVLADWHWTDLRKLSAAWYDIVNPLLRCVGLPYEQRHQPDVKPLRNADRLAALREVVKYACGVKRNQNRAEFQSLPVEARIEIASALAGMRLVQTYGKVRRVKAARRKKFCPNCGAPYQPFADKENWGKEYYTLSEYEERYKWWNHELVFHSWLPPENLPDYRAPPAAQAG